MLGFSFFNKSNTRQFKYRPRYFDPEKEELEQRKKEILGDKYESENDGEYKPGQYIKDMRIRRGIVADKQKKGKRSVTTRRFVIFLILLFVVLYYLLS